MLEMLACPRSSCTARRSALALQEMGGETVPETVGGQVSRKTSKARPTPHHPGHPPGTEAPAELVEEEGRLRHGFFLQKPLPLPEIGLHGHPGRLPQKSQALLGTFTPNAYHGPY